MRRLSAKRRWYLNRQARRRSLSLARRRIRKQTSRRAAPLDIKWKAPAVFGVWEQKVRTPLLKCLSKLRRSFMDPGTDPIALDFSATTHMYAEGALLFYAELLRLIKATKARHPLTCRPSRIDKVCQVFEQIGLNRVLGITAASKPADDDVVHWRFAHGHRAEGEKYEDILAEYDGTIAEPLRELLYTGITEAMTNVMNHAYDLKREDGYALQTEREWWMFSQCKDGELSVTFCDLGAGIPRTLPLTHPKVWSRFLLLGRNLDSHAIEYSVRDSVSRTKRDYRGKGLGQIVRFVDAVTGGRVVVFSNRGVYFREGIRQRRMDFKDSILGTMIHWKFPLQQPETT